VGVWGKKNCKEEVASAGDKRGWGNLMFFIGMKKPKKNRFKGGDN